jgi:hypothetical protein
VSTHVRWPGVSSESDRSVAIPSTPFMGVRISWLMEARKEDLARVSASARTTASRIAVACRAPERSRTMMTCLLRSPIEQTELVSSSGVAVPSA